MGVLFVVGRAGSGKTRYCIDAVVEALRARPLEGQRGQARDQGRAQPVDQRRLILLAPEQASFQMERALALRAPGGGYWRAEVLSFSRLARRVLDAAGGGPAALGPGGRALALRVVAQRQPEAVQAFGRAARTPGFFAGLDALIGELIGEAVSPAALRDAAARLGADAGRRRVEGIAALFEAYERWLGADRIDPGQRLAALRERLATATWLPDSSIWVDGFAGFTGQEIETLVALARRARDVTITLMCDPDGLDGAGGGGAGGGAAGSADPLRLFHKVEQTYWQLRGRFERAGVAVVGVQRLPIVGDRGSGAASVRPRGGADGDEAGERPRGGADGDEAGERPREGAARYVGLPRFAAAPELAWLEHALAVEHAPLASEAPRAAGAVRIVECETHGVELEQAARFIRERVANSRGALRWRDFAVIARDLTPFTHLVADVFDRYEVPYFLDRRRPLSGHALVRGVAAMLEVVASDFAPAATVRLLRSGLLPLKRFQAERLEEFVCEHEVRGAATWRQPGWRFGRSRPGREAEQPPETYVAARQAIVDAFEPLVELHRAESPPSGAAWARALHETLAGLGVARRVGGWIVQARKGGRLESAELHRKAWEGLCGALDDFHETLADVPLELAEFAAALRGTLHEQTAGLAPPTLDQVLVSSIDRSRHPEIKIAWVFGLNEGLFPARPGDDALLGPELRAQLSAAGLAGLRPKVDDALAEPLLFYIALTRASAGVVLSYAKVDRNGEELFASPLLENVRRVLPQVAVAFPDEQAPPVCRWEFARGYLDARAAFRAAQRFARGDPQGAAGAGQPSGSPDGAYEAGRRYARYRALRAALTETLADAAGYEWLLRGASFRNACDDVPGYARRPDTPEGVVWRGSPSEIETYLQCPFKHFAQYGLRLQEPARPSPLAMDLGQAAHEILAQVLHAVIDAGQDVADLDDERWLAHLRDACADYERRQPDDLRKRRPRTEQLTRMLYERLEDTVRAHAARYRRGECRPLAAEWGFGRLSSFERGRGVVEGAAVRHPGGWALPAPLPALAVVLPDGRRAQVVGDIDRVDCAERDGQWHHVVYDYKSSGAAPPKGYLINHTLTLFIYALAVRQALGETEVSGGLLAPLYLDADRLKANYARQADANDQLMHMLKPRGQFEADIVSVLQRGLDDDWSPVVHVRRTKKGYYSNSDTTVHMRDWLEVARRTIALAAQGIADGKVGPAPLVVERRLPCKYCALRAVCRFERALNRVRAAEAALPQLSAVGETASGAGNRAGKAGAKRTRERGAS